MSDLNLSLPPRQTHQGGLLGSTGMAVSVFGMFPLYNGAEISMDIARRPPRKARPFCFLNYLDDLKLFGGLRVRYGP